MNGTFQFFYRLVHPLGKWIRSRPLTFKLLFNLKVPHEADVHYDTTTILFRRALRKEIKPDDQVLEVGIGQAALLSIYVARQRNIKPHGVDIAKRRVESSLLTARMNGVDADFWQSDLFANVHGAYDVIFFNPPYVNTEAGKKLNLTERLGLESDAAWNGGADGTEVIRRFMKEAGAHLSSGGRLMLGVQDFYVGRPVMNRLTQSGDYQISGIVESFFNPSKIYILKKNEK